MEYCDKNTYPYDTSETKPTTTSTQNAANQNADKPRDDDVTCTKDDQFQVPNSFVRIEFDDLKFYECCGEGSFGSVYRALWISQQNKEVAVKQLRQMDKEAHVLSILSHRNIIQFYGAVDQSPNFGIVTEYAPYGSLYDYLTTQEAQKLEYQQVLTWSRDIALGMNYLHEEAPITVIHRDLKSKNVVICSDFTLKICDFGASRFFGDTVVMTVIGTYPWMAPELIQGLPTSERCDVYSFGVVLWEQLTRELPFKGLQGFQVAWIVVENGERPLVPASCPKRFALLMQACWSSNPDDRPSFYDVIAELNSMMNDEELGEESIQFMDNKENWMQEIELKKKELVEREREIGETKDRLREREKKLNEWERNMKEQMKKQTLIGVARYKKESEKLNCAISGSGEGAIDSIKDVLSHIMSGNNNGKNSQTTRQDSDARLSPDPNNVFKALPSSNLQRSESFSDSPDFANKTFSSNARVNKKPFIKSNIDFNRTKTDNSCDIFSSPTFNEPTFDNKTSNMPRCKVQKQTSCEEYNFEGSKMSRKTTSSDDKSPKEELWESAKGDAKVNKTNENFEYTPTSFKSKPPPHMRRLRSHNSTPCFYSNDATPFDINKLKDYQPMHQMAQERIDPRKNKRDNQNTILNESDVVSALKLLPQGQPLSPGFAKDLCKALQQVVDQKPPNVDGLLSNQIAELSENKESLQAKSSTTTSVGSNNKSARRESVTSKNNASNLFKRMTSSNNLQVTSSNNSQVSSSNNSQVMSSNNLQLTSSNNSQVTSSENLQVASSKNAQVTSSNNSQVSSSENSQVMSSNNLQVTSSNNSQVSSSENSQVMSSNNLQVTSSNNSQVTSSENLQVASSKNAQVTSSNNSQVTSSNNSQVTSSNNSQVASSKNAQVTSSNNTQVTSSRNLQMTSAEHVQATPSLTETKEKFTQCENKVTDQATQTTKKSVDACCQSNPELSDSVTQTASWLGDGEMLAKPQPQKSDSNQAPNTKTKASVERPTTLGDHGKLIVTSQSADNKGERRSPKYCKSGFGRNGQTLLPSYYKRYFSDEGLHNDDVTKKLLDRRSLSVPDASQQWDMTQSWLDDVTIFHKVPKRCSSVTSSHSGSHHEQDDVRRCKSESPDCSYHPPSTDSGCGEDGRDSEMEYPPSGQHPTIKNVVNQCPTSKQRFTDIMDQQRPVSVEVKRHRSREVVRLSPTPMRPNVQPVIGGQRKEIPRSSPPTKKPPSLTRRISLPCRFSSEVVVPGFRNPTAPSPGNQTNKTDKKPTPRSDIFETDDFTYIIRPKGRRK